MPVAWPALSLHCSAGFMLSRKSAVVPTIASELPHAVVMPFCASSASASSRPSFTTTLRHASPPLALMYFAHALTPSTEPWNRPGRSGEPVSAITVTVIVVGLTPTSVDFSCVVAHLSDVVGLFVGTVVAPLRSPPTFLPLPQPAATSTTTSSTPIQPKRFKVPPLAGGPSI